LTNARLIHESFPFSYRGFRSGTGFILNTRERKASRMERIRLEIENLPDPLPTGRTRPRATCAGQRFGQARIKNRPGVSNRMRQ